MSQSSVIAPEELDPLLEELILGEFMGLGTRLLGTEYERLILDRENRESAPLAFCRGLMRDLDIPGAERVLDGEVIKLVRGDGFELSMEPGGQLEVSSSPASNLAEIDRTMEHATGIIDAYLASSPYELVCLGHAPVTRVQDLGLLPRERYRIMDASMPSRGPLTANMMRATAGFQLTYDVTDREDAGRKMALLYRLSPLLMAITANSRMVAGEDSGYASYRHKVWWETDSSRSGVPEGSLHAETAIRGYLSYAKKANLMFLHRDGQLVESEPKSLAEMVDLGEVNREDLEAHLSTLFPFVRLRNYVEIRCFDSVDWSLARSVLALVSGIVYCKDATASAERMSEQLVVEDPGDLKAFHLAAARDALDARSPSGVSLRELGQELISFSAATLGGGDCNWSRPEDLDEVRRIVG
ncbi:MAG: glutamate-cysteine ligase family protein [Planctomycetota bacterium]|jgi:glutamate--cysteine ligase